jgi:putative transposase
VISELTGVESAYEIPDVLCDRIVSLLPSHKRKKKAGRPRMNDRKAISAIFYVLRTGCECTSKKSWSFKYSTVHDRFQEWRTAGVFKQANLLRREKNLCNIKYEIGDVTHLP